MNQNANIVALAKVINQKGVQYINARETLKTGLHKINFTVNVAGTLNIGVDYDTAPTVSFSLLETLALTLRYCGVTREAAKALLTRVLQDSIEKDGKGAGALAETLPWITEMVEEIQTEIIATMPRQYRKGAVRTNLEFTEVNMVAI